MNPQSALGTIAEMGIAIAGFGGVIAAIASVTPRGLSAVAQSAFGGLLLGSIMIVAFSLVPQIFGSAGVADPTLWRSVSSLHAFYLVMIAAYRTLQLRNAGGSPASLGWVIPVMIVVALAQVSNAIWFQSAWIYLSALLALVLTVFGIFPRLLEEIWKPTLEAES